jgi:hypothetical protein
MFCALPMNPFYAHFHWPCWPRMPPPTQFARRRQRKGTGVREIRVETCSESDEILITLYQILLYRSMKKEFHTPHTDRPGPILCNDKDKTGLHAVRQEAQDRPVGTRDIARRRRGAISEDREALCTPTVGRDLCGQGGVCKGQDGATIIE